MQDIKNEQKIEWKNQRLIYTVHRFIYFSEIFPKEHNKELMKLRKEGLKKKELAVSSSKESLKSEKSI